jgi:hypothetical protein
MQGHVAYQLKSSLFQPDLSQFPAITAAFPGRSGVIIFIFISRENPVKYTDPDGRAAGDHFETMDAAAKDFAETYNDDSIQ